MALLQNQTINAQYPRRLNGGVNAGERAMFGRGERRNVFAGYAAWSNKSGVPSGHLAPSAWVLPLKAGGMSSHNAANGASAWTGAIAEGRSLSASFAGLGAFTATGQLVVSGSGAFTSAAAFSGNVIAALAASGATAGVANFTGSLTAKGNVSGAFLGDASFTATRYGTGALSGSFTPPTTLEAAGFASYLLDQENIETGLTFREALRVVLAATGGKVSGGGTTTITFRNPIADDTDRIVATVDSNGNRTAITYDLD